MNKPVGLVALSVVAAVTFGVQEAVSAEPGVTDNEIVIGLFAPLSGALAAFGTDPLYAAKMIYDDVNKKGGIFGRKIRVVIEDDKCNASETNAVAQKLVTVDQVFLLNGGACTAAAASLTGYVTRQKIPYLMLNASGDPALFPPTQYVFGGFGSTQGAVGSALMQFSAEELKAKRVAYITSDDDYGNANFSAAKAAADKAGVEIVAHERIPNTITDVTSTMLRVRQAKPDVIISAAYPQGAVLIVQARQAYGMTQPIVQATQGVTSPMAFAGNVGDKSALKDFYYSGAEGDTASGEKLKQFFDEYRAANPDRKNVSDYMPLGIASALGVVAGLQKAGHDLTRDGLLTALESIHVDTPAVAGPIEFSPTRHDAVRGQIIIKFDGTTTTVMPKTYEWDGTRVQ